MTNKPPAFIIEDDPHLNQLFVVTLKNQFEVTAIHDGTQALALLEQHVPELIVLDMNLPGAPGAKILAYVRAEPRLAQTRVILATADAQQADILSEEADIVLLKPISPAQLRELANRLVTK